MFLKFFFLSAIISCVSAIRVCKTNKDYYSLTGRNCWWSNNARDMPELVTQYGYNLETYNVTTNDKYILKVFRLKHDNPVGIVLLMHFLTGTSVCWVDQQNASLAYSLYYAGYDVWMGNFRGNFYSRAHETLDPNKNEFWDFTYEEMGIYDIPAMIKLIKTTTGATKISYVGLSLGSTAATIYASKLPHDAAKDVNLFILMSPGCFMANTTSYLYKLPSYNFNEIYEVAKRLNMLEFAPHSDINIVAMTFCRTAPGLRLCTALMEFTICMCHVNQTNINPAYMPVFWYHFPGGTGLKVQAHYEQSIKYKRFAEYDFGMIENIKRYGSKLPPLYPVENIIPPIFFISGTKDTIFPLSGVKYFQSRLTNNPDLNDLLVIDGYGHLDNLWAIDHEEKVNRPIIKALNKAHAV